jgi:hypothetical protein
MSASSSSVRREDPVFIELTDHLRCTEDHPESFLVLLPAEMNARRQVVRGSLGCPACGRVVEIEGGVADFGGGPSGQDVTTLTAEAAFALLGLDGPGGHLALIGGAAAIAAPLAALLPGVSIAMVNPPEVEVPATGSVLRAGRFPIKAGTMRGVVVGADHANDPAWLEAALGAVLSGNRAVVEGGAELPRGCQVLAEAGGVRVVRGGQVPGSRSD